MRRLTVKADEVTVGDMLAGVVWNAGRYEGADEPSLTVTGVRLTPENRYEGDRSLIVEIKASPAPSQYSDEMTYYSADSVEVWR